MGSPAKRSSSWLSKLTRRFCSALGPLSPSSTSKPRADDRALTLAHRPGSKGCQSSASAPVPALPEPLLADILKMAAPLPTIVKVSSSLRNCVLFHDPAPITLRINAASAEAGAAAVATLRRLDRPRVGSLCVAFVYHGQGDPNSSTAVTTATRNIARTLRHISSPAITTIKIACTNDLTAKDLAPLSRLLNLRELDFHYNTAVETLDLGGLPSLETVSIRSCQKLGSLNLKGCPHLKSLVCTRNSKLRSVDLSNNPALREVHVHVNRLKQLDVSSAGSALRVLRVAMNRLPALDLSSNPGLTHLDVSDNLLGSLDLHPVSRLTHLNCSGNRLTTLDLSGCGELKDLDMRSNRLHELDLSPCTALRRLKYDTNLTEFTRPPPAGLAAVTAAIVVPVDGSNAGSSTPSTPAHADGHAPHELHPHHA